MPWISCGSSCRRARIAPCRASVAGIRCAARVEPRARCLCARAAIASRAPLSTSLHLRTARHAAAPPMPLDPAVSRKLRALSLLGIAMVVVGHAPSYRDPSAPSVRSIPYSVAERLFTDALPRIVVMMFFAVSGFLLLWGHDG